jgi:hypothetical protein
MHRRIYSSDTPQPQHVLPWKVLLLASQVIPILIELIRSSSGSGFGYFRGPRTQRICDPGRRVVAFQLTWDATTEIENPVFHEGERGRNGLRHGLRLLAVAKSWSDTNGLADEVVPGGSTNILFYNVFICQFLRTSP